jgi:hypothetical protein
VWVGGVSIVLLFYVPNEFSSNSQGVLNKSQFVPQDVPNSTLFLSLMLCPKLSCIGGPKGRHLLYIFIFKIEASIWGAFNVSMFFFCDGPIKLTHYPTKRGQNVELERCGWRFVINLKMNNKCQTNVDFISPILHNSKPPMQLKPKKNQSNQYWHPINEWILFNNWYMWMST